MIGEKIEVEIAGGLDVPLPRMVTVRQKFEASRLADIPGVIGAEFARPEVRSLVKSGQSIAVGCGSRDPGRLIADA